MNPSDRRALRMCEMALAKLAAEPQRVRALALANVATWERTRSCSAWYVRRWRELLDDPNLATIVLAATDEGQALRANNPFAGLFDRGERNAILAAAADEQASA